MDSVLLFISGPEIFITLVVVLLLFGSKKIPELAKGLGKGLNEFKKATNDIKQELEQHTEVTKEINDLKKNIDK